MGETILVTKKFLYQEGRTSKMTDKVIENNQVTVMGKIISDFTFSHEIFGEGIWWMWKWRG